MYFHQVFPHSLLTTERKFKTKITVRLKIDIDQTEGNGRFHQLTAVAEGAGIYSVNIFL